MPCIYCLRSSDRSSPIAHIFPESIFGDHAELVLKRGEVCGPCNNRLAKLEARFKDSLGLIPMLVGPGVNKRGRPTTINAPGLSGTRDPKNPRIAINRSNRAWKTSDGRHVRPALTSGEKIEFAHLGRGPEGEHFKLAHEMRVDLNFVRVLAKIAFETICVHRGADYCADVRWHRVRAFILRGEGSRTYFMPRELTMTAGPGGGVTVPVGISLLPVQLRAHEGDWVEEWLAAIRLGPSFIIDLSDGNNVLANLVEKWPTKVKDGGLILTCHGKARGDNP